MISFTLYMRLSFLRLLFMYSVLFCSFHCIAVSYFENQFYVYFLCLSIRHMSCGRSASLRHSSQFSDILASVWSAPSSSDSSSCPSPFQPHASFKPWGLIVWPGAAGLAASPPRSLPLLQLSVATLVFRGGRSYY